MAERDMIRIPEACPIRLFSESEEEYIQWIPLNIKAKLFDEDGNEVSRRTWKKKRMSGFANPEHRKKAGRRPGSRTKSNLKEAIKHFQAYQHDAARLIVSVMQGDEKAIGGPIKPSERLAAAKYVVEAPAKMKTMVKRSPQKTVVKSEGDIDQGNVGSDAPQRPYIQLHVQSDGSVSKQ